MGNHITQRKNVTNTDELTTFQHLICMGFAENESWKATKQYHGNLNQCINHLTKPTTSGKYDETNPSNEIIPQINNVEKQPQTTTTRTKARLRNDSSDSNIERECDACSFVNKSKHTICQQCQSYPEKIIIDIRFKWIESFKLSISYSKIITVKNVLDKVIETLNAKYYPLKHHIYGITEESFVGKLVMYYRKEQWDDMCSKSLTEFKLEDVVNQGLYLYSTNKYHHKVNDHEITCEYIKNHSNCDDIKQNIDVNNELALKCPIYKALAIDSEFTEDNLLHLYEFKHFRDESKDKPLCKYYTTCKSFVRLENGSNRLGDRCHIKMYRHPPRNQRQIKLSENINSFIINKNKSESLYGPCIGDENKYKPTKKNGYIEALIEEVIQNGYKYDLCLECTSTDACTHDNHSILSVVDKKMNHIRHTNIGKPLGRDHMLALVLYTGGDCNYDLCSSQRNGDYKKWKWFDHLLFWGIRHLKGKEMGSYKIYTGLSQVKLGKKEIMSCHFPTYTSASWIKDVSATFVQGEGMIIEIDESFREWLDCCDVSWISKFPDECEILISRSEQSYTGSWPSDLSIMDEQNGIQTVFLRSIKYHNYKSNSD